MGSAVLFVRRYHHLYSELDQDDRRKGLGEWPEEFERLGDVLAVGDVRPYSLGGAAMHVGAKDR